jgi:hypothetical protein
MRKTFGILLVVLMGWSGVALSQSWHALQNQPNFGATIPLPSTRAKWRSSLSASSTAPKKCLTRADIVREAIYRQLRKGSHRLLIVSDPFLQLRRAPNQRCTSTGIPECVSTFTVTLPKTMPEIPRRPCEAMTTRSQPFDLAVSMMA